LRRHGEIDPAGLSISFWKLEIACQTGFVTVVIRSVTAVRKTDVVHRKQRRARMGLQIVVTIMRRGTLDGVGHPP